MHVTLPLLVRSDFPPLRRGIIDTLQVNLGYRCNQSCLHCHVNAGPNRTEEMSADTIAAVVDFLAASYNPQGPSLPPPQAALQADYKRHLAEHFGGGVLNLEDQPVRVADHCFGCTAGQGSSCGGALAEDTAAAPSCAP